jgi:hypothetical protein
MFVLKRLLVILIALPGTVIAQNGATAEPTEQLLANVEVQASIGKPEFLVGEPITIKVVVTNRHKETIRVWDRIERSFRFSAKDRSGKLVKKREEPSVSGLFPIVSVRSGTDFNSVAFINEYLDFPGPGIYKVTYRGYIHFDKGSPESLDEDAQVVEISGVVDVKLRKGSVNELENALQEYVKQLRSADNKLQRRAALALSVLEPVIALKMLRKALQSENGSYPKGASQAAWAIGHIGTEQAIQALIDLGLHDNHWRVRTSAIRELGRRRINKALPALTNLLSDKNPIIRITALRSLGEIGDKISIPEVELRFNDPDENVRATAKKVHKKLTEDDK